MSTDMSELSTKPIEQDGWNARAAGWMNSAARATSAMAPRLLSTLGVRPGDRVLDLCCGPGVLAGAAYTLGAAATGVDFAPAMILQAQERVPEAQFLIDDAHALSLPEKDFDAIACNFGLQHLADPLEAMKEAHRALKFDGRFGWTHWLEPSRSDIVRLCTEAIAAHGDRAVWEPMLNDASFRLADPDIAAAEMRRAGFSEVTTEFAEASFEAPRRALAELAATLIIRTPLTLDRHAEDARQAIETQIAAALSGDTQEQRVRLKATALFCVGVKRERAASRKGRFKRFVKDIISSDAQTGAKRSDGS